MKWSPNRDYQRQLFLDYVVRGDNFPERRAQLLQDFKDGKELTGPKGLRRKLGAFDLEYFGRAYLAHYFVRPSPAFHGELDKIWREGVMKGLDPGESAKEISRADGCHRAIEAPRGHAKSTTFTFKDSIHASVYAYKHYILILSDSSEQAEGFLADIKTELEENTVLKEDFGELEGKVWKSSVILLSNGVKIEQSAPARKSVVGVTNNGDPTSSSAMTWKTTRTSIPRSRERSSATGSTRRSRRRATPTQTSSTSGRCCTSTRCLPMWRRTRATSRSGIRRHQLRHQRRALGRLGSDLHRSHQREPAGGGPGVLRGQQGRDAGRHLRLVGGEALVLRPHGHPRLRRRGVVQQ